jgi:hypothetical protein
MVDDLEYALVQLVRGRALEQQSTDAAVQLPALVLGDQRVGRLLHAVVDEAVAHRSRLMGAVVARERGVLVRVVERLDEFEAERVAEQLGGGGRGPAERRVERGEVEFGADAGGELEHLTGAGLE